MQILIGCEKSGVVRRAFAAAGHDVISVDLEAAEDGAGWNNEWSEVGWHWQGDLLAFIYNNAAKLADTHFDLFIAHPECRYMSVSGMHWTHRGLRDPQLTEDALAFARKLFDAPYPRICIENPVSIMSTRIRRPDQSIQPHQFGHDASKRTCLWLKGLPLLAPTRHVAARLVDGRPRWANQTDSGQNRLGPSERRSAMRAETYPGVATAMVRQWGGLPGKKLSTEMAVDVA